MELVCLGIGAAGNKAALQLLEDGVLQQQQIKLLNTTTRDIPEEIKLEKADMIVSFSSTLGGCGKEPEKGYEAIVNTIKSNKIDFNSMVQVDTKAVIIVTSVEGGTGCGATPIIAKLFTKMNLPVHIFAMIGFQDETRGITNTLKFFRNLDDNIILHTIDNKYFLDYTDNYKIAEDKANKEFSKQVSIMKGSNMIPSAQNIDETDLYKVTTTPGYMDIQHISLDNVKSKDSFNKVVQQAFDNVSCLEYDKSAKRLAVIVNADQKLQSFVDDKNEVIKRYIGEPYETYRHIQYDENQDEYINIIVSGMNFPEKGIRGINRKLLSLNEKINSADTNSFKDIFDDINLSDSSNYDMSLKRMTNPEDAVNDLLNEIGTTDTRNYEKVVVDSTVDEDDGSDDY